MELLTTYLRKPTVCTNCNNYLKFFSKRRRCKVCSNLELENVFCKNCSVSLKHKVLWPFNTSRFCNPCHDRLKDENRSSLECQRSQVDINDPESPCLRLMTDSPYMDSSDEEIAPKLMSSKKFKQLVRHNVKICLKDPMTEYDLVSILGEGSGGAVYLANHKKTEKAVALKRIKINEREQKKQVLNEIGLLQLSKHNNIIECFKAFEHKK